MEPRIRVTFEVQSPYEAALLTKLYQLLVGRGDAGREQAKELFCKDCYARLKREIEEAYPDDLADVLGERDARAIQGAGSEN
jgi:hypothetical protein